MINGQRVKQARELLGLTQTQLAEKIDVTQPAIAQIEAGLTSPSEETIARIALRTGFPVSFFKEDIADELPLGSLLYRAHANTTAREKIKSYRLVEAIFEFVQKKSDELTDIPVRIPRTDVDPLLAAHLTRSALGVAPDTPIPNLVNAAEHAGVLVVGLPIETEKIDAFSVWAGRDGQKPLIGAVVTKPADRLRFSVAHELGHLVMHYPIRRNLEQVEEEAHKFASELLLPEAAIRAEITPPVTLSSLAALKPRWRASIQALIRRAFDLTIITERQYRYLFEQLSARGWRKREPVELQSEKPRMFRKMLEVLYGSTDNVEKISAEMRLPVSLVKQMIAAHSSPEDLVSKRTQRTLRFVPPVNPQ